MIVEIIENRRLKVIVLFVFSLIIFAGCGGKTDSRLVGSWKSGAASSLILKADGTYQMTLTGSVVPNSTITNESGTWSVKDDRLNLKNEKSGAVLTHRYQLNDQANQLQLTLDSSLNPNKLTVTYSKQ